MLKLAFELHLSCLSTYLVVVMLPIMHWNIGIAGVCNDVKRNLVLIYTLI